MGMTYLGHVFLDFYNHFASSLAALVKSLGLAKALDAAMIEYKDYGGPVWFDGSLYRDAAWNIGKNFFPYTANSRQVDEELGYAPVDFDGALESLPLRFWELDDKSPEDREVCTKWLESLRGYRYNVKDQLRPTAEVYRNQMIQMCVHDPFQCLTLPTFVFRTSYMKYYDLEKYPLHKLESDAKWLAREAHTGGGPATEGCTTGARLTRS